VRPHDPADVSIAVNDVVVVVALLAVRVEFVGLFALRPFARAGD